MLVRHVIREEVILRLMYTITRLHSHDSPGTLSRNDRSTAGTRRSAQG